MRITTGLIAAKRTAVCPRYGAFKNLSVTVDLAAPVMRALIQDAGLEHTDIDEVIMGNALYGGGNPARVAALAAGLSESVAAMTIDTQCCSGLDAIRLAQAKIQAGQSQCIIAGGLESYSQAPVRINRTTGIAYERPPFTPWALRDPDMLGAAANLAQIYGISRQSQETYAIQSHANSQNYPDEILNISGIYSDTFTRRLKEKLCHRLPVIQGTEKTGLTDATVAIQADAAAAVVVTTAAFAEKLKKPLLKIVSTCSRGANPEHPALASVDLCKPLVQKYNFTHIELMEAFAVQAILNIKELKLNSATVNQQGGALARGHPVGASGAILAAKLFHAWQNNKNSNFCGLATIAAAGGLASAIAVTA